jgi:flagellar motor switch protein FliN
MLSQAEIDALLSGADVSEDDTPEMPSMEPKVQLLSAEERDALGEIGNISMGTSATTLYALLGQKVNITTPRVTETTWDEVSAIFNAPYVAVRVQYTEGLRGANLLIMKEQDVKVITDLMMGGDGTSNVAPELNELHLSAISEAMNQMVGSSATSLSSMFDQRVDIAPPESTQVRPDTDLSRIRIDSDPNLVKIAFSLKVGDLIDSEIMQLIPVNFAKELVANLLKPKKSSMPPVPPDAAPQTPPQQPQMQQEPQMQQQYPQGMQQPYPQMQQPYPQMQQPYPQMQQPYPQQGMQQPYPPYGMDPNAGYPPQYGYPQQMPQMQMPMQQMPQGHQPPVNVQPAQFQAFEAGYEEFDRKNISLLMDVQLQIAVELGRTSKKIRDILEFGQGSIVELDKLAGEPVDILVNGKAIAKGEVVVIDESFGVRITDIIHPSKRL